MTEGTRMKLLDDKLLRHDEILGDLSTNCRELKETQAGIRGTLELILDRLTTLERAPVKAPECAFPVRDGLLPNPIHKASARFPIPPPKWELPSFEGNKPKEELYVRFGETVVEDTVEEFNKLSQIGTLDEFLGKSEDLKVQMIIRNPALNEAHFLSSFIGALKEEN
ncbi:hypothetical protein KY290_000602 [Solanum tuberosum]|uniref:Uncharacterized protein n=1 Tax=Solanum tuberosum TaxID=4113 RepID=A0ABQ7WLV3_SOLTU|nr:hypothetical protein KY289_000668 [Solanum tuberosum]KAH0781004.1 hypothetical protein KY290_000602 [Solanum tuberosum]